MTDTVVVGAPQSWPSATSAAATAPAPAPQPAAASGAPALAPTSVPTAFNIGWLVAELRAWAADRASPSSGNQPAPVAASDDPPSRLETAPSAQVRLAQVRAKITLLGPEVANQAVPEPRLKPVFDALDTTAADLAAGTLGTTAVDALLTSISDVLTAASIRMGYALDLGFDLANMCRTRRQTGARDSGSVLLDPFGTRVVKVQQALADLASSLPAHAARGVSLSLAEWQSWAGRPTLDKAPVSLPDPNVTDALERQGDVWRSVLAGEKLGQDMLSADDYFGAMGELVKGQVLKRPVVWIAVLASVALVIVGAIFVLSNTAAATKVVGGVIPLLGVAGISVATVKSFAGNIARELERQVWGAELDYAIAGALTVAPGNWGVTRRKVDTPPPRGVDPHTASSARVV